MLHDLVIWNPPRPPVRYDNVQRMPAESRSAGQERQNDFTEADYVPVRTYLKPVRSLDSNPLVASTPSAAPMLRSVAGSGAARAAIELYSSIFNYRDPSPVSLSVLA